MLCAIGDTVQACGLLEEEKRPDFFSSQCAGVCRRSVLADKPKVLADVAAVLARLAAVLAHLAAVFAHLPAVLAHLPGVQPHCCNKQRCGRRGGRQWWRRRLQPHAGETPSPPRSFQALNRTLIRITTLNNILKQH